MKKLFTLAAAVLASLSLWAAYPTATTTYALEDLTFTEETLTYEKTGLSGDAQKLNKVLYIDVEVPCASANGNLYLRGTSSNTGRFATIWGSNGTARDEARKVAMKNGNSDAIAFTEADILEDGGKYYIRFSSADNSGSYFDYKISGFSYVLNEACETREVDHVDTTLAGVAVNGEALSDIQMATLYGALTLNLTAEYVEAPTVTFTVQTDTYYVGEETPSTKNKDIDVVAALNPEGKWQAQQTVGEQTYTITAVKPATATVTYMDGATVLGEEIVKVGESATKHGEYEVKPMAEFQGWYTDAELTSEADLSATVGADMVLYGKFVKAYAQSIDFEQMVLNNGKSYDDKSALTAAFYDYKDLNELDSLNNSKGAARNEPYLGLKIKKQGGYIACNVATGSTIRVKFGYVENDVLAIAGNDTMTLTPANKTLDVLEYTATADTYVKIQTTSGKTVVIKQIMVDEPIVTWMYPITYAEAENGKVEGWTIAFPNEVVNLTVTPDSAYHVASVTAGDAVLVPVDSVYSFEMIAQDITVSATFAADEPIVPTLYTVTIDGLTENGAVGVQILGSSMKFEEGTELTLANIPDEGYELDEYIVYKTGEPTTLVTVTDGKFIMPAYDVTVSATFKLIPVVEMFTVTLGTYEHGNVAFIEPNEGNKYEAGAEVRLSVTPDEGYELEAISLEGIDLAIPVVDGVATFNMPAQNVTVLATFKQTSGQGFDNIDASMKATKRIINGKLFIEKNGKLYDAQGAMVK